jgi:hypothetical protein
MMKTITHIQPHSFAFRGAVVLGARRASAGMAC